MNRKDFIETTIPSLSDDLFETFKQLIIGDKYLQFSFLSKKEIDRRTFSEKAYDFFEKVELYTDKEFDSIIEKYAVDIDSVVSDRIDRYTHSKNGGATRAKWYYDKARWMKKTGLDTVESILDYSRIMMCLYMAIINNKHKDIADFDYSLECLNIEALLEALKKEEVNSLVGVRKKRFYTRGPYSKGAYGSDRSTFIILIIMYFYIKNMDVEDED